jgi:hypothetical protein
MWWTAMLWEVFVTRFQEAFEQYEKHRLSSEGAGSCRPKLPPMNRLRR